MRETLLELCRLWRLTAAELDRSSKEEAKAMAQAYISCAEDVSNVLRSKRKRF